MGKDSGVIVVQPKIRRRLSSDRRSVWYVEKDSQVIVSYIVSWNCEYKNIQFKTNKDKKIKKIYKKIHSTDE